MSLATPGLIVAGFSFILYGSASFGMFYAIGLDF